MQKERNTIYILGVRSNGFLKSECTRRNGGLEVQVTVGVTKASGGVIFPVGGWNPSAHYGSTRFLWILTVFLKF